MKIIKYSILLTSTLLLALCAKAADAKPATAPASDNTSLISSFRCEKFNGSLGDLKLKMIETCNLDKPFSSSLSRTVGGEDIFMFCCHKAK